MIRLDFFFRAPLRLPGWLSGSTVIAGDPDSPVRRRVQIVESVVNAHGHALPNIGRTTWVWADPAGSWKVTGLDPAKRYHAIAYDHTGQYDPVIKMNLVPSVD